MSYCPHCDETHGEGVDFCPRTGRPIVDIVDRMVGRTIAGKYKLIRSIGQGGMGTIFEAEHTLIGNKVAVKLLHEPFAEKREPVQRLYREAQATGAIGHPNIIKVFDVGETDDGVPFLVMELLKGESLGDHIERLGPRRLRFVMDVSIQLLSALHAAHRSGIIHRDLKSDNIFLLKNEEERIDVKILDFGISKFIDPDSENLKLTQTGSVLGTPYYMSPEQASGRKDLDHRIDIYSAGVIIYETLLGNIPHTASNYNALLIEIITEEIKSFRWRRPDVPEALEAAVLKALAREREKRWDSALDFMEALVRIREGIPSGVLDGEPELNSTFTRVDRDSHTLDINDDSIDEFRELPVAFETGGRSATGLFPASPGARMAFWAVLTVVFIGLLSLMFAFFLKWSGPRSQGLGSNDGHLSNEQFPIGSPQAEKSNGKVVKPEAGVLNNSEDSQLVLLKILRSPADATATADGKTIPVDGLELKEGTGTIEVVVTAAGYESKTINVIPSRDMELTVKLEKKVKGVKAGKRGGKKSGKQAKIKPQNVAPAAKIEKNSKPSDKNSKPKKTGSLDSPMDNPF